MSTASRQTIYKSLEAANPGADTLDKWSFEKLATDPTTPAEGQEWVDTANGRRKVHLGGSTEQYAFLSDLTAFTRYRGPWDASTGVPTAAGSAVLAGETIKAGDRWLVSTAGTIAGIDGGDDLEIGDWIVAKTDGASAAADFTGIETNKGQLPAASREVQTLSSLPADTPTAVTFAMLGTIDTISVRSDTGLELNDALVLQHTAGNAVTLTSSTALTNLTVHAIGAAA